MKKSLFFLLLAASLLVFAPASRAQDGNSLDSQAVSTSPGTNRSYFYYFPATNRIGKTGERINVYSSGEQTYPENTPFHIAHGWIENVSDGINEDLVFKLEVDGVYQVEDFSELFIIEDSDPLQRLRHYLFNFPEGMTGGHTFAGHWLGPCSVFYDDCTHPDEIVENHTSIVQVTFVP